jgi:hypothetical protein
MRGAISRVTYATATINFGVAWMIFFGLVFGSGIMPVNFLVLALIIATISIITASLSVVVRNWNLRWLALLISAGLAFCLSVCAFYKLADGGLRRPKSYARSLALEVEARRKLKGAWPAKLDEIPINNRPQVSFLERWPYDYQVENGLYDKVGGFLIYYYYHPDFEEPKLSVGRRDILVDWNWKESRWENEKGWIGRD